MTSFSGDDQNVDHISQKMVDMIQDWNIRIQRLESSTNYGQGYLDGVSDVFNDFLNVLGIDAHEQENKSGAV